MLRGGDEEEDDVRVFATYDELLASFDAVIKDNPDEARFRPDSGSFDVYEPFVAGGMGQWASVMTLDRVTRKTVAISAYCICRARRDPRAPRLAGRAG